MAKHNIPGISGNPMNQPATNFGTALNSNDDKYKPATSISKVVYEVFIPGFQYDSIGPIWIDKIEIEETNGELLYECFGDGTVGYKSLSFYKQTSITPDNNPPLKSDSQLTEDQYADTEFFSEKLTQLNGAKKGQFYDIISDEDCEKGSVDNTQSLHHYLTVYPNLSDEYTKNQNKYEHVGFCYLKTTDSTKVFNIKYRLYSKLGTESDGESSKDLYMLVYEGSQKYTPVGITLEGDIDFEVSGDLVQQYCNPNHDVDSKWSIVLNPDYTIPVLKDESGQYRKARLMQGTYKIDPDYKYKSIDDAKIYVYPQWECRNKEKKSSQFYPKYILNVSDDGKNDTIIISSKNLDKIGVAPALDSWSDDSKIIAFKNQRNYFDKDLYLGYNGRNLIKRGVLHSNLKSATFNNETAEHYRTMMYFKTDEMYSGASTSFMDSDQEQFGFKWHACGSNGAGNSRTFNLKDQMGLRSDYLNPTFEWGDRYHEEYYYTASTYNRNYYIGTYSYIKFITTLVNKSIGYGVYADHNKSLMSGGNKEYDYSLLTYTDINYLYKYPPIITILNLSTNRSRWIFADTWKEDDANDDVLSIKVKQTIGTFSNYNSNESTIFQSTQSKGKDACTAKIVDKNQNIIFENPQSSTPVTLKDSGEYKFTTTYTFYHKIATKCNTYRGFLFAPNAKIFYDVSNLEKSNKSDFGVYTQINLIKEVIQDSDSYSIPVSYNKNAPVYTNLVLKDSTPKPLFERSVDSADKNLKQSNQEITTSLDRSKEFYKYLKAPINSEFITLPDSGIYVLHVNYLKPLENRLGGKISITLSIDDKRYDIAQSSEEDTFAFYIKNKQNIKLGIDTDDHRDPIIKSVGLYQLDPECSELDIIKEKYELNETSEEVIILNNDDVNSYIFMPMCFCFSEYGKYCYYEDYNYVHIPSEPYLKVAAWYEADNTQSIGVSAIKDGHPYYNAVESKRFADISSQLSTIRM